MMPDLSLLEALRRRIAEVETYGAAAARGLVEEEDVLLQTLGWYEAREGGHGLVDSLRGRLDEVATQLEQVLPLWEEQQLLARAVRYYDRRLASEDDPERFRVLRQQLRHHVEIERRRMSSGRSDESPGVTRPSEAQRRPPTGHAMTVGRAAPTTAGDEDSSEADDAERISRSSDVQERVGRFVREYLEMAAVPEVSFPILYDAVSTYARKEWPDSSDRARIENFRYALRRAAPLFGLIYEQGRVRRATTAEQGVRSHRETHRVSFSAAQDGLKRAAPEHEGRAPT
jgi:hypothetical protein